MDLKLIGIAVVLLIALSGCSGDKLSKQEITELGESWSLSNEELAQYGITFSEEPKVEAVEVVFGDLETLQGSFFTMHEDPAALSYIIYIHSTYEGANNHYKENLLLFKESTDKVLEERDQNYPYLLTSTNNTVGEENLQFTYNYKNVLIIMIGSSKLEKNPNYNSTTFMTLGSKIADKIDKNNPFLE